MLIATLSISPSYLLYFVPLVVSISLVFGATRHEDNQLIIQHAIGTARWIFGFMAIIFFVLLAINWMV
ncbi:hypothetical protein [Novipirellula artificiosorum]|uniref:Uncharacterized protein n=1 Tax=Novipirellula artificiosorum TaxID=2528016 RepID=A0A5C6D897_9BACT|nr:hypothetical protein [Novipirellula artificiosorum]TWU33008.1 hypothetical protein Poly41_53870 [Novipirellula artificiosorum]